MTQLLGEALSPADLAWLFAGAIEAVRRCIICDEPAETQVQGHDICFHCGYDVTGCPRPGDDD